MPKLTYISCVGDEHVVDVGCGASAMDGAIWNLVPGIEGDCGGFATCGTCLVFVDPAWIGKTGPAEPGSEAELVALRGEPQAVHARLACQIKISEALDGLVLRLPESQY